jgi:hypothetical protein
MIVSNTITFQNPVTVSNTFSFPAGTVSAPAFFPTGDTNTGIFFPAADTMAFAEGGVEAMRIDSDGDVGIGVTNPTSKLHVGGQFAIRYANPDVNGMVLQATTGTNAAALNFTNTGGAFYVGLDSSTGARIGGVAYAGAVWHEGAYPLVFGTNNIQRMRIDSNGSISAFALASGAGTATLKIAHATTGVISFDTSSRLVKENIENSTYGLTEVLQLQPRKYFRTDDQQNEIGLIADEVVDILPELVPIAQKKSITRNPEDVELIPIGVNYDKLTAVLVKAIQELSAKNDALEARIAALEESQP